MIDFDRIEQETGKVLLSHIAQFLAYKGQSNNEKETIEFKGEKYNFSLNVNSGQISVVAKDIKEEVLNNRGFTDKTREEDKKILEQTQDLVQQLALRHTPLKFTGLKP